MERHDYQAPDPENIGPYFTERFSPEDEERLDPFEDDQLENPDEDPSEATQDGLLGYNDDIDEDPGDHELDEVREIDRRREETKDGSS